MEEQQRLKADMERGWCEVYEALLKKSYVLMSAARSGESEEKEKLKGQVTLFCGLWLKAPCAMELASTYAEAKELFVAGLSHLMRALDFYVLDGFVTDHVRIAQRISSMYKFLAFFEADKATKCKLHKRRMTLLKHIEEDQ